MGLKGIAFAAALVGACGAGTFESGDSASEPGAPDGAVRHFEQFANAHRVSVGCTALRWDGPAAAVAQAHAEDMVRRDFFSHTNPDGKSPFDRLRAAGVTYRSAAENIAYGYSTAAGVLEAWMNSDGHRRNLENCAYTHHGVGLSQGKWVHVFIGR
ncbi:MAG TPA: CAP domain-containing protein [Gemmatimonadales bacterium]|nr:CAP domain-containing protein [Gemmatimonadales bacterium]